MYGNFKQASQMINDTETGQNIDVTMHGLGKQHIDWTGNTSTWQTTKILDNHRSWATNAAGHFFFQDNHFCNPLPPLGSNQEFFTTIQQEASIRRLWS